MSKPSSEDQLGTIANLASQLSDAVHRADHEDLSTLAQMHGWCEKLAGSLAEDNPSSCPEVAGRAQTLVKSLESLILGEVEDTANAFDQISGATEELVAFTTQFIGQANLVLADPSVAPASDAEDAPEQAPPEPTTPEAAAEQAGDEPSAPAEAQEKPAPATEKVMEPTSPVSPEPALEKAEPPASQESVESSDDEAERYVSTPLQINVNEIDFVKGFVEEATEHVEAIETALLEVERAPEDSDLINNLFRPFHTIKGMAGFLNLRDINCLTHEVETLLDQGRKGERKVTAGLIDIVFEVIDILKNQIGCIAGHLASPQGDVVPQPPVSDMIDRLRGIVAGRVLVDDGISTAKADATAPSAEPSTAPAGGEDPANTPPAESAAKGPAPASAGARPEAGLAAAAAVADASLRIDTAKLDALVDMVGELVIAQTLVNANSLVMNDPKLNKDVSQVTKIVRNVQEAGMAMRMVPIGGTFQRMARLVRDVSRKAGKQVELTISGEETELDKNVIQQISDPLVHMVRNAVDHGVESPEVRSQNGKEPVGHVHLAAYHQGGNIVIEISDDGKGLDPEVLIHKAVEKGVIDRGAELNDQQAYQLIFAPGFSTAAQVTDISGRGVGMDVVKRNLEQLRGRIDITSAKGKGSTFYIRLPLTLAIIDGMAVSVGTERFIIPTITIEQALRPLPDQVFTVQRRGEMIQVRGKLVPLIQLGQMFRITDRMDPCETMVVITNCDGQQVGLVVNDLLGQQQVVIKSLGERFEGLQGTSGAAILGDGRVGLILDPAGLAAAHQQRQKTTTGSPRTEDASQQGEADAA